jgi:hypothetical protein
LLLLDFYFTRRREGIAKRGARRCRKHLPALAAAAQGPLSGLLDAMNPADR